LRVRLAQRRIASKIRWAISRISREIPVALHIGVMVLMHFRESVTMAVLLASFYPLHNNLAENLASPF